MDFKCFFSYFGGKSKIIKYYPKPTEQIILEPFCGAASYSLYYYEKDVELYDKDEIIINLWSYLINTTPAEILKLPLLNYKESLDNHRQLTKEEKYLIGFNINQGSAQPKKTVQKYSGWNKNKRQSIADNLYKIKHWKVFCKDYLEIENKKATFFIDPPYFSGGKYYRHHKIDYDILSEWCKSRFGQVIVCENSFSRWLDFKPLVDIIGQKHKTKEVIWTNFSDQKIIDN